MGGILATTNIHDSSMLRTRMDEARRLSAYRGNSLSVQHPACWLNVQARHDEALLIDDADSSLAIHGYMAPSSLSALKINTVQSLKARLNRIQYSILQGIHGEYSLVFFNKKTHSLIFYCSTSATRPLFFTQTNNNITIGTEIRQILHLANLRKILNKAAWAQHLTLGHQLLDMEETLYGGVKRAHSGCIYILDKITGKLAKQPFKQALGIDDTITKNMAEEMLLGRTQTAVSDCLREQPMGLAFSGGLDSGLILACADSITGPKRKTGKVSTHSIVFPNWEMDEQAEIEKTLYALKRVGKYVDGTQHPPSTYLEKLSNESDLAPAGLTDCYVDILGPSMSDENCQYLLFGFAGDFTLGYGLSYIPEYFRRGRVFKAIKDAALFQNQHPFSFKTALRRLYHSTLFPRCNTINKNAPSPPAWLHDKQKGVFQGCLDQECNYIREYGFSIGPRMLIIDALRSGAWSDIIEQQSARWGMDLLSPLGHQGLVDFSFMVPPDWLDGGRHNRLMIREASKHLLPDSSREYRPKILHTNFTSHDTALLSFAGNAGNWRLADEQLVNPEQLNKLIRDCRNSGSIDLRLSLLIRAEHLARRFD